MEQGEPQPSWGGFSVEAGSAKNMNIRSLTTLVGVFPVISYLGATERSTLGLQLTEFSGRFTLPFEAEWGEVVLPEGDYNLHYGTLGQGVYFVEILGKDQHMPHGIFLVRQQVPASVVQNALVCTCRGGRCVIRALELPAIGKSVSFAFPSTRKGEENPRSGTATPFAQAPI